MINNATQTNNTSVKSKILSVVFTAKIFNRTLQY